MQQHVLHVVTTGRQPLEQVASVLRTLPRGIVDIVHIREKQRSAREIAEWYETLRTLGTDASIYINDRLDAAAAVRAPGVQLGYASLSPRDARAILPERTRIGLSVHSAEEAALARSAGVDFVLYGHIYATGSKEGLAPRGIDALAAVVAAADVPVIAIGGMEPGNVDEVLSTGCAGIAVMSGILANADPSGQAMRYREQLDKAVHRPKIAFSTEKGEQPL